MPRTIDIGEAKAQPSRLTACAEIGGEVIIARNDVPVARSVPVNSPVVETNARLRDERTRRPRVTAADGRAARGLGRT